MENMQLCNGFRLLDRSREIQFKIFALLYGYFGTFFLFNVTMPSHFLNVTNSEIAIDQEK